MKVPCNITDGERPAIKVQKGDRKGDKAPEWQSVCVLGQGTVGCGVETATRPSQLSARDTAA